MHYVYLLQSESFVDQRYVGVAADLKGRLSDHNSGKSPHTLESNFKQQPPFADTASRSRGALHPSFAINIPPSEIRGRRECRAPDAPAAARVV
jgi:hypothetical protein